MKGKEGKKQFLASIYIFSLNIENKDKEDLPESLIGFTLEGKVGGYSLYRAKQEREARFARFEEYKVWKGSEGERQTNFATSPALFTKTRGFLLSSFTNFVPAPTIDCLSIVKNWRCTR